ncbi:type II restriction endonuclease [Mycoplasma sp. HU2014]|nr:type II restriction endonuclease [Mycoplasma sp. HU2014]
MKKLDFKDWINNLQNTIVNWEYFVDFEKVFQKAQDYKKN